MEGLLGRRPTNCLVVQVCLPVTDLGCQLPGGSFHHPFWLQRVPIGSLFYTIYWVPISKLLGPYMFWTQCRCSLLSLTLASWLISPPAPEASTESRAGISQSRATPRGLLQFPLQCPRENNTLIRAQSNLPFPF